jgi:hypothetical protein
MTDSRSQQNSVEALEAEVDRLSAELQNAKHRLYDAKVAESGISIGDIVIDKNGVRHRVSSIDVGWKKVWLKGNPQKKDGSFGTSERHLFDYWTKELQESA